MELIKIVHQLRQANGLNERLEILKAESESQQWIKFLKYTYDPFISYGVSAPKRLDFDTCNIDDSMFETFDQLANRELSGNATKEAATRLSTRYGEIPRLVFGKSLKAGVSTTTINKAYPGLIPVFSSMKRKDVPIIEYPVYSSIKFDGCKIFVTVKGGSASLTTSSGLSFNFPGLESQFRHAIDGVYENELTYKEGKVIHRPVITGMLNSLIAGTKTDLNDYFCRVYDWIPLEEWNNKKSAIKWFDRQIYLTDAWGNFDPDGNVKRVEHQLHSDAGGVIKMFEELTSAGFEGTMSRYADDPYMWKRVDRLIKKKSIKEATLMCVGTTPHSNPSKGVVGSLQLVGVVDGKEVAVSTGSGLNKFDINCEPDRYIGKEIEILYNSVTETESGYSLFLPRFKRVTISTT